MGLRTAKLALLFCVAVLIPPMTQADHHHNYDQMFDMGRGGITYGQ